MIAPTRQQHPAVAGIDLARVSPRERAAYLDAYEVGYMEGIEAGRRQVEAELAAEWAALRAEVMPRLLSGAPYADLAERRGQAERALTQRRLLRERGVA
jgi:hypothetical protein